MRGGKLACCVTLSVLPAILGVAGCGKVLSVGGTAAEGGPPAPPATVATTSGLPLAIAVSGSTVAWLDYDSTLEAVSLDGGTATTVSLSASGHVGPATATYVLAGAGGAFYAGLFFGGGVVRVDPSTASITAIVTSSSASIPSCDLDAGAPCGQPTAVATNTQDVFFALSTNGQVFIWKAPLAGGTPILLATEQDDGVGQGIVELAANDTAVYWATVDGTFAVHTVPTAGGTVHVAAPGSTTLPAVGPVAVDPDYVYWSAQDDSANDYIFRAPVGGGPVEEFAPPGSGAQPCSVMTDGTDVFWATNQGAILRQASDAAGGTPDELLPPGSVFECSVIALGSDAIYYLSTLVDDGGVPPMFINRLSR